MASHRTVQSLTSLNCAQTRERFNRWTSKGRWRTLHSWEAAPGKPAGTKGMMSKTLAWVFALTALTVGGVCLFQAKQLRARGAEVGRLRHELAAQTRYLEAAKAAEKRLKRHRSLLSQQLDAANQELDAARERAAQVAATPAIPEATPVLPTNPPDKELGKFGGAMAKLLANPEIKKMIAQQQRVLLDPLYGPLFKELGLSPEQIQQFKELLLAQQMKGVEQAGALLGAVTTEQDRAERAQMLADLDRQNEEAIKAFLGEEGYPQYQHYRETLGDRMQLNQFHLQLAGGEHPLDSEQQAQLLHIMNEERQAVAADFAQLGWVGGQPANPQDLFAADKFNQVMDLQQNLGQRVYDRARSVLQPEQLDAFGAFQTNQLSLQRIGIQLLQSQSRDDASSTVPSPPPGP